MASGGYNVSTTRGRTFSPSSIGGCLHVSMCNEREYTLTSSGNTHVHKYNHYTRTHTRVLLQSTKRTSTCIHTHSYVHKYIHTFIQRYIHISIHSYIRTHILHIYIHTGLYHTLASMYAEMQTLIYLSIHSTNWETIDLSQNTPTLPTRPFPRKYWFKSTLIT